MRVPIRRGVHRRNSVPERRRLRGAKHSRGRHMLQSEQYAVLHPVTFRVLHGNLQADRHERQLPVGSVAAVDLGCQRRCVPVRPLTGLEVGLHHPEPLVIAARDLGEDVRGVLILRGGSELDRLTCQAPE